MHWVKRGCSGLALADLQADTRPARPQSRFAPLCGCLQQGLTASGPDVSVVSGWGGETAFPAEQGNLVDWWRWLLATDLLIHSALPLAGRGRGRNEPCRCVGCAKPRPEWSG